jgi:hypothetical protein
MLTIESLKNKSVEEGECWIWQGYFVKQNVPMVYHDGTMRAVRRLIFQMNTESESTRRWYYVPSCGDYRCINPEHIKRLTAKQHMSAMAKSLANNPSKQAIKSAKISEKKRKLTPEQVSEILNTNELAYKLAEKFGVCRSTVGRYRQGNAGISNKINPFAGLMR